MNSTVSTSPLLGVDRSAAHGMVLKALKDAGIDTEKDLTLIIKLILGRKIKFMILEMFLSLRQIITKNVLKEYQLFMI